MNELGPSVAEFNAVHGIKPSDRWTYIYGLHDPRDGALRYIGKSNQPDVRYKEHVKWRTKTRYHTHCARWIAELRELDARPVLAVIDAVPSDSDWQCVEKAYIAAARQAGDRLTNITDGGEGVVGVWLGRKHRPESLAKMSADRKGRKATDEWRRQQSERFRGREFSPEWRAKIRDAVQKLSPVEVRQIRGLLADRVSQYEIASRFGVHQGTVSNIARGVTYRHID